MEILSENLKTIKGVWAKTQEEMAKTLGITTGSYISYERGVREPSIDFMCKLENITGIPVKRLWSVKINHLEIPERPKKGHYEDESNLNEVAKDRTVYEILKDMQKQIDELKQKK